MASKNKIVFKLFACFTLALALSVLFLTACKTPAVAGKNPENGSGDYAAGKYRNLFIEAGYSQKEVDDKLEKIYQHFFKGDENTQRLYYPSGSNANGPLAYMPDINNNDVRSEGMSYGMMICVQLNQKAEFDALWNWAMTYMYQKDPNHPTYGYFSWSMNFDGTARDELPAPDGEEYFVMALYFASNRWGNGEGIYNYKACADRLLSDMVHREPITGMVRGRMSRTQTVGKEVNDEYAMILFSPDSLRNNMTDPSYHLPAFYELWSRWGPKQDSDFWKRAAQSSRDFFQKCTDPNTGLNPNYANFDGTPYGRAGAGSTRDFRYDAWRTAMNWSVDWSWWAKDTRERQLSDKLEKFFESQGMDTYGDLYTLQGNSLGKNHSIGLVSTNAVTALAATDTARARKFVEGIWKLDPPSGRDRYYGGLLYYMSMLHCSGQFKIWKPK